MFKVFPDSASTISDSNENQPEEGSSRPLILDKNGSEIQVRSNTFFQCVICRVSFSARKKFTEHLKSHDNLKVGEKYNLWKTK